MTRRRGAESEPRWWRFTRRQIFLYAVFMSSVSQVFSDRKRQMWSRFTTVHCPGLLMNPKRGVLQREARTAPLCSDVLKAGRLLFNREIFPLRFKTSIRREPWPRQHDTHEGSGDRIMYAQQQQTETKFISECTVRTFRCQTLLHPGSVLVHAYWSLG